MLEAWHLQAVRLLDAGGPMMWVLAGVSMVIWSGLVEHLLYLREATPRLLSQARSLAQRPVDFRTEWLRRMTLNRARLHLQRALPLLRTLVTLCPLLGLVGTVMGMIQVFDSIAVLGQNPWILYWFVSVKAPMLLDLIERGELGLLKEVLTDAFMAAHGG